MFNTYLSFYAVNNVNIYPQLLLQLFKPQKMNSMKNLIFLFLITLYLPTFSAQNPSINSIKNQLGIFEGENDADHVAFTLHNGSAQSIPLIIPKVMNPNLSPFSNSAVDLKIGQEILFRVKGKNYILFTVDNTIKNGDVIEVDQLLKQRKKELGLD